MSGQAVGGGDVPRPDPGPRLCIGMATYDDFDGVWFTIQAIRMYHAEVLADLSFLVIDNHPGGVAAPALAALADWVPGYRYVPFGGYHGTAVKDLVFREADAEIVCCLDCHVLLRPGALAALLAWFDARPSSRDLVQGPLLHDDLQQLGPTHLNPTWGSGMFGQWARDPRIDDPAGDPFEIPMQGLGVFACRKDAWPGLNPRLRGFSGDEGYIHEKVRRGGGRVLCHPAVAWVHRFPRPAGAPYANRWEDRVRNYYVAWDEIGWDMAPAEAHFREMLGSQLDVAALLERAREQAEHPLMAFDAIFCVAPEIGEDDAALSHPAIGWRIEHLPPDPAVEPGLRRLARWREAVREAARRGYEHVLVLEDATNAPEIPPTADLAEEWDLCVLSPASSEGVDGDASSDGVAVAVHARAYDRLLSELPAGDAARAQFLARWGDLNGYLRQRVAEGLLVAIGAPLTSEREDRPAPASDIELVELAEGLMVRQAAPPRVHQLNNTASIILQLCDGERRVDEIARLFGELFGMSTAPDAEVAAGIDSLRRSGVLAGREGSPARATAAAHPLQPATPRSAPGAAIGPVGRSDGFPPVSCICPTYGRPELLEEAIQSFLLQDYPGRKELIVLNDLDRQHLTCEHPEVSVVNLPRRIRTLGEKHNAAVALASHDLLFVWDDDDIYLPHRLTFSIDRFDPRKGFFKPGRAWFWNDGRISGPETNLFAAGSCWSRELFERVRSYAPMGLGHDAEMEARFEEAVPGSTSPFDIRPEEIYYLYRWGGTHAYHVSGFGDDQYRAVADAVHERLRLGLLREGPIALAPHWKADYVELVREHLTATG